MSAIGRQSWQGPEELEPQYGDGDVHPIRAAMTIFVDELRGLKEVIPLIGAAARQAEEEARRQKMDAMVELELRPPPEGLVKEVPDRRRLDQGLRTRILLPSITASGLLHAQRDVGSAVLLMMGAHFDRFLGEMVRAAFEIKPSLRQSLRREVSFSELSDLTDIDEVHSLVVEKEIDHVLHLDRAGQVRWFEKRCGMRDFDKDLTGELTEVAELRNLVAHNGGVVTAWVGAGWKKRKAKLLERYRPGDEVEIREEEVNEIHDILIGAATSISQGAWRKLRVDEMEAADRHFHEHTYTRLALEEFELARRLLQLGERHHDSMSHSYRLVRIVNLAQSYKWLGDREACLNVLGREAWESHEHSFQLAASVLEEQWERAEPLMEKCIDEDLVTRAEFEDWPVFRQFRETQHFRRVFMRVYGAEPEEDETD